MDEFIDFLARLAILLIMPVSLYYKIGPPYDRRRAKRNLELSSSKYDVLKYL